MEGVPTPTPQPLPVPPPPHVFPTDSRHGWALTAPSLHAGGQLVLLGDRRPLLSGEVFHSCSSLVVDEALAVHAAARTIPWTEAEFLLTLPVEVLESQRAAINSYAVHRPLSAQIDAANWVLPAVMAIKAAGLRQGAWVPPQAGSLGPTASHTSRTSAYDGIVHAVDRRFYSAWLQEAYDVVQGLVPQGSLGPRFANPPRSTGGGASSGSSSAAAPTAPAKSQEARATATTLAPTGRQGVLSMLLPVALATVEAAKAVVKALAAMPRPAVLDAVGAEE